MTKGQAENALELLLHVLNEGGIHTDDTSEISLTVPYKNDDRMMITVRTISTNKGTILGSEALKHLNCDMDNAPCCAKCDYHVYEFDLVSTSSKARVSKEVPLR
jgi:hypothetical protein